MLVNEILSNQTLLSQIAFAQVKGPLVFDGDYLFSDLSAYSAVFDQLVVSLRAQYPKYQNYENVTDKLHVSLKYLNETCQRAIGEHNSFEFSLLNMLEAEVSGKKYIIIPVHSKSAISLRKKIGLTEQLNFKGHWVPMHITVLKESEPIRVGT